MSSRRGIASLLVGVAVALVYALCLGGEMRVSPDSAMYMDAARSLLAGEGFTVLDGRPVAGWPPAWPGALALLHATGVPLLGAAQALNALVLGLAAATASWWAAGATGSVPSGVAAGLVIGLSVPVVRVGIFVWSEPLYILASLGSLVLLAGYLHRPAERRWLLAASGAAALAVCTRYIGVTLVAAGALALLADGGTWRRRVRDVLLWAALPLALLGAWTVRNYLVKGVLMGDRVPSTTPLGRNVELALTEIGRWVVPTTAAPHGHGPLLWPAPRWLVLGLGVTILAALTAVVGARLAGRATGREAPAEPAGPGAASGRAPVAGGGDWIFALYVLVYVAFLVGSATRVAFDRIDVRLLAPALPPTAMALWPGLHAGVSAALRRPAVRLVVPLLIALWLGRTVHLDARYLGADENWTLSSERWRDSELMGWTGALLERGASVRTNAPDAVQFRLDAHAPHGPRKAAKTNAPPDPRLLSDFRADLRDAVGAGQPGIHLAWFGGVRSPTAYAPAELGVWFQLDTVGVADDGLLLLVRPPRRSEARAPPSP